MNKKNRKGYEHPIIEAAGCIGIIVAIVAAFWINELTLRLP